MASIGILIAIIVYLVMMVYVGFYFSKGEGKEDSTDHFYLGGRQLGPFVTAMSAEASDMSSWLLMGLPGVAYLTGISDAGWTAIGLAMGTYLNWLIVAKRIRRYSIACDAITIPDFFSKRYHDNTLDQIRGRYSHESAHNCVNNNDRRAKQHGHMIIYTK